MRTEAAVHHHVVAGPRAPRRLLFPFGQFVLDHLLLLPVGALLALAWANTSGESYYQFAYALQFWVNDVAMVLFFGLLMKEVVEAREPGGVLRSWRRATLPIIGAAGATLAAAWIYIGVMRLTNEPMLETYWPIAASTDLAISYFIVRLLFGRHPVTTFVLLTGLAANAIAFLTAPIVLNPADLHPLAGAALMAGALAVAVALRKQGVRSFWPYVVLAGGLSWSALQWAGFHPALALVPIVPFMPHAPRDVGFFADTPVEAHDTLSRFERTFHYPMHLTLFLFGLVNAGVLVGSLGDGYWGIPAAMVIGKPLGLLAAVGLALAAGLHLPNRVGWRHLIVASLATASGFTMTLFMAGALLAPGPLLGMTRMGALLSLVSVPLAFAVARVLQVGRFAR